MSERVAIVVGAGGELGRATAQALAGTGYTVVGGRPQRAGAEGAVGGVRAAGYLRLVAAELQMADVRQQVILTLATAFENYTSFLPATTCPRCHPPGPGRGPEHRPRPAPPPATATTAP